LTDFVTFSTHSKFLTPSLFKIIKATASRNIIA
jgi:hypothetical protein